MGIQIEREVADVLAAVGDEGELLVVLYALGFEDLEQAPFGLGVMGLDEGEARGRSLVGDDLSGDHFEPAVAPGALRGGLDVPAVQTDDQWQIRSGQLGPVPRATLDEAGLLVAELVFQALG
jgi:hypothetical protein